MAQRERREREGPNPLNMDFQFLALLMLCGARPDLYKDYLEGPDHWAHLRDLGFESDLLKECLFVFEDEKIKDAMLQMQRATQTLVDLNDYCRDMCPSFGACSQIVTCLKGITEDLQTVDAREFVKPSEMEAFV